MMRKGDVSAKADLRDLKNIKHLYALGALENLKGEILIIDSEPFNTMVDNDTLSFRKSFDHKATLLVYAIVDQWKSIKIPQEIKNYKDLETYIAKTASAHQINIKEPFPFMIKGVSKSFDWHVIDWKEGDTEHSHEKHINSGLNGTIKNKQVIILGFYSDSHHGIFTHHTTNMHLHVKTADHKIAGHVDDMILGTGMILKLPVVL